MPNPRKEIPNQKVKVERLQYESLINETIFRNLYNQQVYFVDTDQKSKNYFKLGFSSDMIFTAGKNLIRIKGKPGMLAQNTPLLIEAVDITGLPLKTSVYDLKNETADKVICIEVHEATPAGDIKLTLAATAIRDPEGNPMPPAWQNEINFKWTGIFEARPFTANRSDILFNEETTPQIEVQEVIKPWNKLTYNPELITNIGVGSSTNTRSSYRLQTHNNTRSKVSYRKSGGHYFITAHAHAGNILDFGGFTADMVGGQLIVAEPLNPRPRSVAGYDAEQVYSPKERGDDFKIIVPVTASDGSVVTMSSATCYTDEDEENAFHEIYIAGAYQTTVLEFISPFEIRVKDPHTTWQGLNEETHRLFEHTEFQASAYRLIWNQKPQSCDPTPLDDFDVPMRNSYAHVKLTNLTPASGDVTRIKSYTRNNQSPADWQLASDMSVDALEMLYCEKETCRTAAGDFSRWGLGDEGILGVLPFWDAEGVGTWETGSLSDPGLSLYYQQGSTDSPPTPDSLVVGNNSGSSNLTGNRHWILYSKLFPKFKKGKMYQLEISSVSTKTQPTTWLPTLEELQDPNIEIYMSGSSFVDDINDDYNYGKRIGRIRTAADKEKHVEQDRYKKDLTKGYKFFFVADDDGTGKPVIRINSGVWQFWQISLKPLDLFGFTPEEFEITFPTPKCDVKVGEAIDFKFEFYNDYGTVANYTAQIDNINWENEHTAVFDNIVTNRLYADFLISTSSIVNLNPVTFSSGIFVEGDTTIGTHATQSLIFDADVQLPNLTATDGRIVTYNPNTNRLAYSDTQSTNVGGTASAVQNTYMTIRTGFGNSNVAANGLNDVLDIIGDNFTTETYTQSGAIVVGAKANSNFNAGLTSSMQFHSSGTSSFTGSTTIGGPTIEIGECCTDDVTIRGDIKMRCLPYWNSPTQILSYDYPTRTVYYSDVTDLVKEAIGGGGCTESFGKFGVILPETIHNLSATSCGDIFYFKPGPGVKLGTSSQSPGTDNVMEISASVIGWRSINSTHNSSGAETATIISAQSMHDQLTISGSNGIRVKGSNTQAGAILDIDYVAPTSQVNNLDFHWSGRMIHGLNNLGGDDDKYYTVDPNLGINSHELDNPMVFRMSAEPTVEMPSDYILSASYNIHNAGWVVPRNGYLRNLQGTMRKQGDGITSMSIEIIRIKAQALYKSTTGSLNETGTGVSLGCDDFGRQEGGGTGGDMYSLFTCSLEINDTNSECRYRISGSSRAADIELVAGDILVPFIAIKCPSLVGPQTQLFNIQLSLG